jgi:hypothetical protein
MTAHRLVSAAAAAVALATAGGAAGCSADVAPGVAALDADGDVVVTVDEVEEVSAELVEAFPETPDVQRLVVFFAVAEDEIDAMARESGVMVSVDEVRRGVADQSGVELGDAAARVVATNAMYGRLGQGPDGEELVERIAALDPVLNPRYGTWDAAGWSPQEGPPIADAPAPWLADAEGQPTG